ncbi:MAG TPA: IS701 family transposase [Candidatus Tectomicrobia bacterium]
MQQCAPLFGRRETRQRAEQYLHGLLVQREERRNAENLAEAIPAATPRALQRFVSEAPWDAAAVIDTVQAVVSEQVGSAQGVFVLDETGFVKQGRQSVGVARQYCGTLGKVGNCQVAVVLGYVGVHGQSLIDGALYLPRQWTDDPERCQRAGVPAAATFQTKAQLGLGLLRQAGQRGHLPGNWVTADELYGQDPALRDALDADGRWYVLEVPRTTTVFLEEPTIAVPAWSGRGPRPRLPALTAASARPVAVQAVLADLAAQAWQVLQVGEGAQGPRRYQFVGRRVWEHRAGLPGRACWLVLRRNLDGSEEKAYLSNAPADTPLVTLGRVGAQRWSVETLIEQAKGEGGLDEYEVRGWRGWYHHLAMVLLATTFLLTIQQAWGEKPAGGDHSPDQPDGANAAAAPRLDGGAVVQLAQRHPSAQSACPPVACSTARARSG